MDEIEKKIKGKKKTKRKWTRLDIKIK